MNQETYQAIISKKDFSQLPKKDVEKAYSLFERRQTSEEEKIRLTRDLLRKVFSAFTSKKLLSLKNKEPEWILRKHISTRERLPYYIELYSKLLRGFKQAEVIDLGAGINGFSYSFFESKVNYLGIEAIGQLTELMNYYFEKEKLSAKAIHMSLFDLENLKKVIEKTKNPKIVFLFKTLDSLEMLEKDYSKYLLKEITPLVDKVVVSFATQSLLKKTRFRVKRTWIIEFIKENFKIIEDFELGGERYVVFENK